MTFMTTIWMRRPGAYAPLEDRMLFTLSKPCSRAGPEGQVQLVRTTRQAQRRRPVARPHRAHPAKLAT